MSRMLKAVAVLLACTVLSGCGATTTVTNRAGIQTTVVKDSQWLIVLLTAGTALVSSILTAWLSNYFSARSERDKRISEERNAREKRTREQIADVGAQIAHMLQECTPYFDQYEEGTNLEAAESFQAIARIARDHGFESMSKIQVLEDKELRQLAEAVFYGHEDFARKMVSSIVNELPPPDVQSMSRARDAFYTRAREVIANL